MRATVVDLNDGSDETVVISRGAAEGLHLGERLLVYREIEYNSGGDVTLKGHYVVTSLADHQAVASQAHRLDGIAVPGDLVKGLID